MLEDDDREDAGEPATEGETSGFGDRSPAAPELTRAAPSGGPRLSYDCSPWAGESRRLLTGMLESNGVPHAWQGTVLVVRAEDEAAVDEMVDDVQSAASGSLDPDLPQVAYEMSGLSGGVQNRLVDMLASSGIPHGWDADGDIVIHERDSEAFEQVVAELLSEEPSEDDDHGTEIDGLELNERLGALFVAADRLSGAPGDWRATLALLDADESLEGVAAPFGVEAAEWTRLLDTSAQLVAAVRAVTDGHGELFDSADSDDSDDSGGDVPEGPADREEPGRGALRVGRVLGGVPVGPGRDEEADAEAAPDADEPTPPTVSVQSQARQLRDLLRRYV